MTRSKLFPPDRRPGGGELMPRWQPHSRGRNNRCKACGEPFPCPAILSAREPSHQVVPTATVRARDLEHQLRAIHDALEAFERDLRDGREQDRPDLVATARGHVAAAMDALEQAGRD